MFIRSGIKGLKLLPHAVDVKMCENVVEANKQHLFLKRGRAEVTRFRKNKDSCKI